MPSVLWHCWLGARKSVWQLIYEKWLFGIFQYTLVTFYGWDEQICNLVVWNFLGIPYTKTTKPPQPFYDHFSATTRIERHVYTFCYVVAYCYTAHTHDSLRTNFQGLHGLVSCLWNGQEHCWSFCGLDALIDTRMNDVQCPWTILMAVCQVNVS